MCERCADDTQYFNHELNICEPCSNRIEGCAKCNGDPSVCQDCEAGYFNRDDGSCFSCERINRHCTKCNESKCKRCAPGWVLIKLFNTCWIDPEVIADQIIDELDGDDEDGESEGGAVIDVDEEIGGDDAETEEAETPQTDSTDVLSPDVAQEEDEIDSEEPVEDVTLDSEVEDQNTVIDEEPADMPIDESSEKPVEDET